MPNHICSICHSPTLLNRQNICTFAIIAGALDKLLGQFAMQQKSKPGIAEPWACLSDIVTILAEPELPTAEGIAQGKMLAQNIEKYWLGDFESLCLSCGFLLMPDVDSE